MDNRNSASSILKSIGLFGGVKLFQIIIDIIRTKIVAVLLGPVGMGVFGLLTSGTSMVNALTGFGLHTSSVRDVAKAYETHDDNNIGTIIYVLRKLVLFTGILGTFSIIVLSPLLSELSFGNKDYTWAFILVSITALFSQLQIGQIVLMQGTFHYRYMANSSVIGSVVGLIITSPLYYFWGVKAIVPVIILTSLSGLIISKFYADKIDYKRVSLPRKDIIRIGKAMLILGLAVALTGVVGTGQTYILRSFLSKFGGLADVGLFTAGMAIASQYINVILQSLGSDYAPRIAALSNDLESFNIAVNRQIKLMVIIVLPFIVPFVVFIRELTILLYSTKFLEITEMIEWIMVGMFFRTISWCMSYTIVAMGRPKTFFLNETIAAVYSLLLYMVGFYWWRFTGIGIAFCCQYLVYIIQMYIVCYRLFGYKMDKDTLKSIYIQLLVLSVSVIVVKLMGYSTSRYILGAIAVIITCLTSGYQLNSVVPLKTIMKSVKGKLRLN